MNAPDYYAITASPALRCTVRRTISLDTLADTTESVCGAAVLVDTRDQRRSRFSLDSPTTGTDDPSSSESLSKNEWQQSGTTESTRAPRHNF
jgi:hypothetical protein